MALRDVQSFDYLSTADLSAVFQNGSGTIGTSYKRSGLNGLHSPVSLGKALPQASGPRFVFGAAIRWVSFAANQSVVQCADANFLTTPQCTLRGNADGTISAMRGGIAGTVLGTTTWVPSVSTWYFVEVVIDIDPSAGSVTIRVDHTPVLTLTGVNTRNSANSLWTTYLFNNSVADYDDVYVCDGSGNFNNDFLGDCIVEGFLARTDGSAAGTNAGLTPSTGTDHGALVDEATPNGDTDYNATTTLSAKDTYRFGTMTSSGGIKGLKASCYARKSDLAVRSIAPVVRRVGADYDGTERVVASAYAYASDMFEVDPSTLTLWTAVVVNAIEAGMKNLSGALGAATVSKYYLHNAAAPYSPATIQGAYAVTAGSVTKALSAGKEFGGVITSVTVAENAATNPLSVLLFRGVTGPLAAQTISGTVNVVIGVLESVADADYNWHIHIYVTQGDSDTPRGTLLTDYTEAVGVNEWPSASLTFKALNAAASLSSLAISAGDRMVIEIGYISRNASIRSGTLRYGTLSADLVTPVADGAAAGTDTTTKAAFITFSTPITESSAVDVRISQMVLEVLSQNIPIIGDPGGGGGTDTGTDPDADGSLCNSVSPLVWITIQTDSGEKAYGKVPIATGSDPFIDGRLLTIGPVVRALSDQTGRFETAHCSIQLVDHDRELRGLAAAGTLLNKRVDVYIQSIAQRKAGVVPPRRAASLVIRDFSPSVDLTFTLQCEDYFGSILGEFGAPRLIPSRLLTVADFPFLPPALINKPVPIAYGLLSDEALGAGAIGVVPCLYVGPRRLSDGLDWDEYVICGHAVAAFQSWFASDLSDVAVTDPASGGHGPRPTKMPPVLEGTEFLIPGYAGWTSIVGSDTFVDYNGHRYTVLFARGQRSVDARNGDVPISINIGGVEEVGDGTGTMIDSLPRQIQHFITNFWIQDYLTGDWLTIPTVNGYSRILTSSFEAVRTTSIARVGGSGYLGAFLLGHDATQQTLVDVLAQFAQDCDCNFGVNRHGQIMASMVNNATAATKAFMDQTDIIEQSFSVKRKFEFLANSFLYRFARNFIPDSRPDSARTSSAWYSDFYGYTVDADDSASIADVAETRDFELEGWSLRDLTTATDVIDQLLTRRAYGPIYARFTTSLCGLDVELGDNITVTHFGGMAAGGWTAKLLRVERIVVDPDAMTVELEGQVV